MTEPTLDIEVILKSLRDQIGTQAQEIAILKATISAMQDSEEASS